MSNQPLRVPHVPQVAPSPLIQGAPGGATTLIAMHGHYYNGKSYYGYIDPDGDSRVSSYGADGLLAVESPVIVSESSFGTVDWHNSPSVLVRSSDRKIVTVACPHNGTSMLVTVSTNAEDVSAWGSNTDIFSTIGGTDCTYANLFELTAEGKLYLFWRDQNGGTTFQWRMATSSDNGATWSVSVVLYQNDTGKKGYMTVGSNGTDRLDFLCGDGAANFGDTGASLYHCYYQGGSYYQSDGTLIGSTLPLTNSQMTKLYDGATDGDLYAPVTVLQDGSGNVCATWSAQDPGGAGSPSRLWYGRFASGVWSVNEIVDAGAAPSYNALSGAASLDESDPANVFLYRFDSVTGRWQVYLYTTTDGGSTWTDTQLTADTDTDNWQPRSPRFADPSLRAVWAHGPAPPKYTGPFACQMYGYPSSLQT